MSKRMFFNIGFMQGRLSPVYNGKIQSFPWDHWENEFSVANELDIGLMEWTLDQDRLHQNPLMTNEGRSLIKSLTNRFSVKIPSVTGDCFMQSPFWKASGVERENLLNDFQLIIRACGELDIGILVIPLVDNGSLENKKQVDDLISVMCDVRPQLILNNVRIAFESDFGPKELAVLLDRLDLSFFGINYDMGNSAAHGYDPVEEFNNYGNKIINVHVKDRVFGGSTVPLGSGSVKFNLIYSLLNSVEYNGNYILQTARANDQDHAGVIKGYVKATYDYLTMFG